MTPHVAVRNIYPCSDYEIKSSIIDDTTRGGTKHSMPINRLCFRYLTDTPSKRAKITISPTKPRELSVYKLRIEGVFRKISIL